MVDAELQLVFEQLNQIKETMNFCESRFESLEAEVAEIRLKYEPVLEERDFLRNRVDPYSDDCKPLADWDEI